MPKQTPTGSKSTTSATSATLEQFAANAEQITYLRQANERLSRQLAEAKVKTNELAEAVYRAASDAATALSVPPIPPIHLRGRGSGAASFDETALVVVSDVQLAKITASYDTAMAEQRMQLYAEKVVSLTGIQRSDHPVREARVYLLGDIVEGELIFPHQPYAIDASLYRQVMVDGPRIMTNFLRSMLATFEKVHVVGVIGNHGAMFGPVRRAVNPATNADRMLYRFLAELLKDEPRISFHIPDRERERDWYAVDYPVGPDYGFLLFHGDQIRGGGFGGFPFYGLAKRVWGWRSGAIIEPFKYAIFGHWHTPTRVTLNEITAWCNGSTESDNTYAQEELAACGKPTQLLLFAHPRIGVTAEYWVHL